MFCRAQRNSLAISPWAGQRAFIPRLNMATSDLLQPFALKRRQFPIRLAFAMSIDKAQGQSLARVGIYLPSPCFSHGQVYVAFSRSGSRARVKVCVQSEAEQEAQQAVYTSNPVWRQLLLRICFVSVFLLCQCSLLCHCYQLCCHCSCCIDSLCFVNTTCSVHAYCFVNVLCFVDALPNFMNLKQHPKL